MKLHSFTGLITNSSSVVYGFPKEDASVNRAITSLRDFLAEDLDVTIVRKISDEFLDYVVDEIGDLVTPWKNQRDDDQELIDKVNEFLTKKEVNIFRLERSSKIELYNLLVGTTFYDEVISNYNEYDYGPKYSLELMNNKNNRILNLNNLCDNFFEYVEVGDY